MRVIIMMILTLIIASCSSSGGGRRDRDDNDDPPDIEEPKPVTDCKPDLNGDGPGHVKMQPCIEILPCGSQIQRNDGIHYVTKAPSNQPLSGVMRLVYEIVASQDAVFVPTEGDSSPRLTLYFQRKGDNWSAEGRYGAYRWFSSTRKVMTPGQHVITAPIFFPSWRAVRGVAGNDSNFTEAIENTRRVGFVLGGGNVGHGVCMKTGTAQLLVRSFTVD